MLFRSRSGEWAAGESLPNEHTLSQSFDVSIGTIRRAVAELEINGVLVRKQGRGTYVSGRGAGALQERFCALRTPDGQRFVAGFELVSIDRRPATAEERTRLVTAQGHGIVEVIQRVEHDGRAIGVETSSLPAELLPRLETQLRFGQHL